MIHQNQPISLAISTCPNDTFAFHAILENKIDLQGIDFRIELLDIQQLNEGLFDQRFDVAKASFYAAAILAEDTVVLPSGAAIGFGVGPLLLSADPRDTPDQRNDSNVPRTVLCPGAHTTATMLFRMFYRQSVSSGRVQVKQALFSDIMPNLVDQAADFGVCIHEGRFTYHDHNLGCVEDLGARWETETRSPLPLGGILAHRRLLKSDAELLNKIQSVIQSSIRYGQEHPKQTLPTMRKYAQEFSNDVLMEHVKLYVNDWTFDLGSVGREALRELSQRAKRAGLVPMENPDIEVFTVS